jgi:putative exporter of polyketide antibiotics
MTLALVICVAVLAVVVIGLVLVLVAGRDPDSRLYPLRASATEAGERTSDLAAEFWDWLRIGR